MDNMIPLPTQNNVIAENPVSRVRLYSGVPWDNKYIHVRLYSSQDALLSALSQWTVKEITNAAPVRVGELTVNVPYTEMEMLDINYLAFKNTGISNEWVFCFVTNISWKSRNSTAIIFELDIFQNNIYKAVFKPCFIERGHIPLSEDTIGGNLIEDNLDPGEIRCVGQNNLGFGQRGIAVMLSELSDGGTVSGGGTGSVMNAVLIENHYASSSLSFDDLCKSVQENTIKPFVENGNIDAVINIYMTNKLCTEDEDSTLTVDKSGLFEGYTPKNNKLYQYPYCYVIGSNECGQEAIYKYELSMTSDKNIHFNARGEQTPMPAVVLRTEDYDGISGIGYLHSLQYTNFGQCSWKSDVYTAWLAQNRNTIAYSAASAALAPLKGSLQGGALGTAAGGAVGAGVGATAGAITGVFSTFDSLAQLMAQAKDREIAPPEMHGKASSMNINSAFGIERFSFYKMSCSKDYAKSIDDFWSTYGYPIKKIDTPGLNTRKYWNYIKTSNCNIQGNIDLAQKGQLEKIFDGGVTIWHTDDVGNYGLNND